MTTIKITEVSGADLYHRYPTQTRPQDALVQLDCRTGALTATTDPEIGGAVPAAQYHGHVQCWRIPALKARAANALLAEIEPLAQRACDGYQSVWDGSNHVAVFSTDAGDACDEIERLCDRADDPTDALVVWDAAMWYSGIGSRDRQRMSLGITAATTDTQLAEITAHETAAAEAETDGVEGLVDYLAGLRDEALDALVAEVESASAYEADADVRRHVVAQLASGAAVDAAALAASYDAWCES